MKTHILQLESFDDVISARDKMSGSKAQRLLLVWPKRGRILRRRVDLVILQRYAAQLGAQMALVTTDLEVMDNAASVGVPVFHSTARARAVTWRRSRRRKFVLGERKGYGALAELRRQTHSATTPFKEYTATRVLAFTLGVLAVLAMVAFLLPGARVVIAPEVQLQTATIEVRASNEIMTPNVSGGLPAELMSVVVEAEDEAPSTGNILMPDRAAQGVVLFTNLSAQAVNVPAGTVVLTLGQPPQRFVTTHEVSVPGGIGETAEVTVRAETAGDAGNILAAEVGAIEGSVGASLTVTNAEPFSGGTSLTSPAPLEEDTSRLRETMMVSLRQMALEALRTRVGSGDMLISESIAVQQVLEEKQDPPAGMPSDRLRLKLRVEMTAWVVTHASLEQVALAALSVGLPDGFSPLDETLRIESLSAPKWQAGQAARWEIRAERQIRANWNAEAVIRSVAGSQPGAAAQRLSADFRLRKAPTIELNPSWWVRLPILPFRIEVVAE